MRLERHTAISSIGVSAGEITAGNRSPPCLRNRPRCLNPRQLSHRRRQTRSRPPLRSIQAISMFDTMHGFAVVGICDPDGPACIPSFRATLGGLEWIEHRLPRVGRTQDGASSPTLTALEPRAECVVSTNAWGGVLSQRCRFTCRIYVRILTCLQPEAFDLSRRHYRIQGYQLTERQPSACPNEHPLAWPASGGRPGWSLPPDLDRSYGGRTTLTT